MAILLPAGLPPRRLPRRLQRRRRRPLRICLVNLMPNKAATEAQFARLLGAGAIPVELILGLPDGYRSRSTPADQLALYRPWSRLGDIPLDALIVTGAPVETLPFEAVAYWPGLCAILDEARAQAIPAFYICWAAQAALYRFHGVPKHALARKLSGVYGQGVLGGTASLLKGFGASFPVPVSRHTEVRAADLPTGLTVLAASSDSGLCLVEEAAGHAAYMFNHLEYDAETLGNEFRRDRLAGKPAEIPRNYFPADDPVRPPLASWRPYGRLLFANWLAAIALDQDVHPEPSLLAMPG